MVKQNYEEFKQKVGKKSREWMDGILENREERVQNGNKTYNMNDSQFDLILSEGDYR